jgi:pimeloyl-ACP methyl ester carboxylesterase
MTDYFAADRAASGMIRSTLRRQGRLLGLHNRYLAATIPNARLVILPNDSHFAMLQNPAEFNGAVLDFLARE